MNGTYNSILNNYIIKNENLKSNLVTSGTIAVANNIEKVLAEEDLLKEMHDNNEVEKLLSKLIDYQQHFVISYLSLLRKFVIGSRLNQIKKE